MKQIFATVLAFLQLKAFAQENGKATLTEEQKQKLTAEYGQEFTDLVVKALAEDPSGEKTDAKVKDAIIAVMSAHVAQALANEKAAKAELKIAQDEAKAANDAKVLAETAKTAADATIAEHVATITKLSGKAEGDPAPGTGAGGNVKPWVPSGQDTHLFGETSKFFAIDDAHKYNRRAYASMLASRGILIAVPKASSTDYSTLTADLGEYYRQRLTDQIQSFQLPLQDLSKFFPTKSNLKDQEVIVNIFNTEFSQAHNPGSQFANLVKGSFKFEDEIVKMYRITFAHLFENMEEIEKTWIADMNKEGAQRIKWSLVAYLANVVDKALMNEQNIRRIKGVFKTPVKNVPGSFINGSDGLLKRLKIWLSEFKMKAFPLGDYTPSTISMYVKRGTAMVPEVFRNTGRLILYMSTDNISAYISNNELLHALQIDYKPNELVVHEYPDVKIVGLPNESPSKRMIWTLDGNIFLGEGVPGEMHNINFEQQDWTLKCWGDWLETVWAYMVGKKFASAAEMPSDYSTQAIFCNDIDEPDDYYISMTPDDTTPSVVNHTSLISVANTVATAITDILDAVIGKEIRLQCGNSTNAVTIAKAGKFSLITAAWNPAVGEEIRLMKRSDGKFIETKRILVTSASTVIDPDDTTPSVASDMELPSFITSENTVPTAITNFVDAVVEKPFIVYGGSDVNASTIANSGNFVLTDAMTLDAGTFIKLVKSEVDDKFYEISRG